MGHAECVDSDGSSRWGGSNRRSRPVGLAETRTDGLRQTAGDALSSKGNLSDWFLSLELGSAVD
jgi:hypothetical protein